MVSGEEILSRFLEFPVFSLNQLFKAFLQQFFLAVLDHVEWSDASVDKLEESVAESSTFFKIVSFHEIRY